MKNGTTKAIVAATVGVVSVLALAACSSGSDEAGQSTESVTSQDTREAAGAPTKKLTVSKDGMPKGQAKSLGVTSGSFKGVELTHNAEAKCSQDHSVIGRVEFNCTNVKWNVFGDAVYVKIPDQHFNMEIENVGKGSSSMRSTQRDYAYSAIQTKGEPHDRIIRWKSPTNWSRELGWGAGIESFYHYEGDSVDVHITVYLNR